jgi:hypothetical protein
VSGGFPVGEAGALADAVLPWPPWGCAEPLAKPTASTAGEVAHVGTSPRRAGARQVLSSQLALAATGRRGGWAGGGHRGGVDRLGIRSERGDDKGRTLRFRTTVVSSSINDAGHGGVADVTAVLFAMQRPDGSAAGQGWISCVNILATDQLCHAAFVLSGGQIEAQAEIPMAATTFSAAITGGTGGFEGVSGQIDNVRVAPGVVDRTFHLLPRHH